MLKHRPEFYEGSIPDLQGFIVRGFRNRLQAPGCRARPKPQTLSSERFWWDFVARHQALESLEFWLECSRAWGCRLGKTPNLKPSGLSGSTHQGALGEDLGWKPETWNPDVQG